MIDQYLQQLLSGLNPGAAGGVTSALQQSMQQPARPDFLKLLQGMPVGGPEFQPSASQGGPVMSDEGMKGIAEAFGLGPDEGEEEAAPGAAPPEAPEPPPDPAWVYDQGGPVEVQPIPPIPGAGGEDRMWEEYHKHWRVPGRHGR